MPRVAAFLFTSFQPSAPCDQASSFAQDVWTDYAHGCGANVAVERSNYKGNRLVAGPTKLKLTPDWSPDGGDWEGTGQKGGSWRLRVKVQGKREYVHKLAAYAWNAGDTSGQEWPEWKKTHEGDHLAFLLDGVLVTRPEWVIAGWVEGIVKKEHERRKVRLAQVRARLRKVRVQKGPRVQKALEKKKKPLPAPKKKLPAGSRRRATAASAEAVFGGVLGDGFPSHGFNTLLDTLALPPGQRRKVLKGSRVLWSLGHSKKRRLDSRLLPFWPAAPSSDTSDSESEKTAEMVVVPPCRMDAREALLAECLMSEGLLSEEGLLSL